MSEVCKVMHNDTLGETYPLSAYVSRDGKQITDWRGKVLGRIVGSSKCHLSQWSYVHGFYVQSYRSLMSDGTMVYGRSSPSICITLRPYKLQKQWYKEVK